MKNATLLSPIFYFGTTFKEYHIMFGDFEVRDLELSDLGAIEDFYNSEFRSRAFLHPDDERPLDSSPAYRIINLIRQHECKAFVRETNYVDIHYRDEFSRFYSMVFKTHESSCIRLHFFKSLSRDRLTRLCQDYKDEEEFQKNYLGYCILRPIDAFRVGRTLIKPLHPYENYFVLCKSEEPINLRGKQLIAEGSPFIQQDTQVGRCAQASLWMAVQYMHLKYGLQHYTPFQITECATRFFAYGRPIPSEGLLELQLAEAIREMGYSPLYYNLTTDTPLDYIKRVIYHYIESEIPVILALRHPSEYRHAALVVGHTFNPDPRLCNPTEDSHNCYSSVQWVDNFIVNDDSRGPYMTMPINRNESGTSDSSAYFPTPYSLENVDSVLVPLPPEVYMKGEDAELVAEGLIAQLKEALCQSENTFAQILNEVSKVNDHTGSFLTALSDNDLVIRTYLKPSNNLKQWFREGAQQDLITPEVAEIYSAKKLPKYVWVTEISIRSEFTKEKPTDRLMYGEIVIDPTAHVYAPNWLIQHFPGLVIAREPDTESLEGPVVLLNDKPRAHLARE